MKKSLHVSFTLLLLLFCCQRNVVPEGKVITITPEEASSSAAEALQEVAIELADGLEIDLWASDMLVQDPIAISMDDQGRIYYTHGNRLESSEFDIRGHRNWMTASISFESVEDRRAFLRKTFSEPNEEGERFLKDLNDDGILDWRDLTVEKEEVWIIEDSNQGGYADKASRYISDFSEEVSDLANGLEYSAGEVFLAVGPDLWRLQDRDGDDVAEEKTSISHGFAVHIGFGAHGMSGVKIGPQGRVWWGIGDIGMNVVDQDGKRWKYPNQGVIVRSERDGSNFEVVAAGLRNTHEFAFDKYGNLISEDNDGDHRGERERLVYLLDGSETGWRINWQFGKYTDPKNNTYKVWMDEGMNVPRWDGQAAYILPCIQNYVNGPTGLIYNPGTALGPRWYDHFFVAEFRGSPANSPVHAFKLKPDGAGFALDTTMVVAKGLLPTGMDFGPDGALYFADWIDGWGVKNEGRIWKLDDLSEAGSPIRKETEELVSSDIAKKSTEELLSLLAHPDMRVRQKAQFALVDHGDQVAQMLADHAAGGTPQLGRIHSIWALAQLARQQKWIARHLVPLLADQDGEVQAQAAKMIGDVRYKEAVVPLQGLLSHPQLRVRMMAIEALGRIGNPSSVEGILKVMEENDDQDAWLRHAGMIALGRIGDGQAMAALSGHSSRALRTVAVVALRRMKDARIAEFLQDEDEYIVAEAARGINDDYSIPEALPALADLLDNPLFSSEALIRRSINANLRVGGQSNLEALVGYSLRSSAPAEMRAEALACIEHWEDPSLHDRVDGRYRGEINTDSGPVEEAMAGHLGSLLSDSESAVVINSARVAARYKMDESKERVIELLTAHGDSEVRIAALETLESLDPDQFIDHLRTAMDDKHPSVRSASLTLLAHADLNEQEALQLYNEVLAEGSNEEKQAALAVLGTFEGEGAGAVLADHLDRLSRSDVPQTLELDIVDAIEDFGDSTLIRKLQQYQSDRYGDGPLASWMACIDGGDERAGRSIFYRHEGAQCGRCHRVFEFGGDAGPGLAGVAQRLTGEQLLESLILPSATFAAGYQVVTLDLTDGSVVAGIVADEDEDTLTLKIGEEHKIIEKETIEERSIVPSAMPGVANILSKKQVRDLVAFLRTLHGEEG